MTPTGEMAAWTANRRQRLHRVATEVAAVIPALDKVRGNLAAKGLYVGSL